MAFLAYKFMYSICLVTYVTEGATALQNAWYNFIPVFHAGRNCFRTKSDIDNFAGSGNLTWISIQFLAQRLVLLCTYVMRRVGGVIKRTVRKNFEIFSEPDIWCVHCAIAKTKKGTLLLMVIKSGDIYTTLFLRFTRAESRQVYILVCCLYRWIYQYQWSVFEE